MSEHERIDGLLKENSRLWIVVIGIGVGAIIAFIAVYSSLENQINDQEQAFDRKLNDVQGNLGSLDRHITDLQEQVNQSK